MKSLRSPKHRYRAEIGLVSKAPKGVIGRRQTTALTANSIDEFRPLIESYLKIKKSVRTFSGRRWTDGWKKHREKNRCAATEAAY